MPIRIARLGSPQCPMAGALATRWGGIRSDHRVRRGPKRSGASSLYGRMARLGKADTQAHSGQLDAAIATWKEMTTGNNDDLPVDAILIESTMPTCRRQHRGSEEDLHADCRPAPQFTVPSGGADGVGELEGLRSAVDVLQRLKIADCVQV